jgi:phage gpG-like protein
VATVTGLRTHSPVLDFEFVPSLSIMAKDVLKLGLDIRSFKVPLQRAVKEVMIPSIRQNFDSEGRPPWPELEAGTLMNREYAGYDDGPILNRSGALRRVATQLNIWTINQQSATVRDLPESVWYGKVQQAGTDGGGAGTDTMSTTGLSLQETIDKLRAQAAASGSVGKADIPPRPFIMFQDDDPDKIEAVFGKWLDERIALAGW